MVSRYRVFGNALVTRQKELRKIVDCMYKLHFVLYADLVQEIGTAKRKVSSRSLLYLSQLPCPLSSLRSLIAILLNHTSATVIIVNITKYSKTVHLQVVLCKINNIRSHLLNLALHKGTHDTKLILSVCSLSQHSYR